MLSCGQESWQDILLRFLPLQTQLTLQIQPQLLFQRRCLVARLPGSESQRLELAQAFISEVSCVRIASQETHRSFGRFLEIHQPMLQSQIQITGWYCKTRNWLGLHPISHSRHNTLSIILRGTLTSEMTTSPYSTASGEDPSNDRSNAWGSWPVIAGWDRTKWPTYARAVIMPMYTKPKPYYAMSRKYICSAYHRVCFSMQYCSKTSHRDISSDVQSTECHTLVCRINDPAMIIAMIAGPQGTRAEDYAVHMSPQAKLPVRFMSSCPHTNTNNM